MQKFMRSEEKLRLSFIYLLTHWPIDCVCYKKEDTVMLTDDTIKAEHAVLLVCLLSKQCNGLCTMLRPIILYFLL